MKIHILFWEIFLYNFSNNCPYTFVSDLHFWISYDLAVGALRLVFIISYVLSCFLSVAENAISMSASYSLLLSSTINENNHSNY